MDCVPTASLVRNEAVGILGRPASECRALRRLVADDRLRDRDAVTPGAHEALLRGVAERVLAPLAVECTAHEGIEPLPGAVPIEGIRQAVPRGGAVAREGLVMIGGQ